MGPSPSRPMPMLTPCQRVGLWVAEGFGSGRLRPGPGTWGSLVGMGWLVALLTTGQPMIFWLGTAGGIVLSVWLGGAAEHWLHTEDPPSVVLDEISAIPLTFTFLTDAWHHLPGNGWAVIRSLWPELILAFVLFRVFDIAKPGPIRRIQNLHGGWGVTMDDVLAAILASPLVYALHAWR